MAARETALSVLIACRTKQAWSDGALKEYVIRDKLDGREAALATRLVYSVLQNRMLLDFTLSAFLKGKLRDLQPVVLDILRLGACQLLYFDKIPESAAVNEAVKQTRRLANPRAAGLVNGLLRSIVRNRAQLPQPPDLETRYSHPAELTALLRHCVGQSQLEALLQSHNEAPPITAQVNTLRCSAESLQAELEAAGVASALHPWCPDCLILEGTGNLERLAAYRDGLFYVQDSAARLAAMAAGVAPDMAVLDCCAAPGGKSFAAAIAMENRGKLVSCDLHAHKIPLLQSGAERMGLTVLLPQQQDASKLEPDFVSAFDCVIADVPCSGLGVIRKKPDIRYKALSQIAGLPAVQLRILETQAQHVKPGGVLLYSTCTIVPEENEGVINDFLQNHPAFSKEAAKLPILPDNCGEATLLPCREGTDGFYFCRMRKAT